MMARNTNVPFKGRIQKRKTYHLQIITFRLQRAAGPYRSANTGDRWNHSITSSALASSFSGTNLHHAAVAAMDILEPIALGPVRGAP